MGSETLYSGTNVGNESLCAHRLVTCSSLAIRCFVLPGMLTFQNSGWQGESELLCAQLHIGYSRCEPKNFLCWNRGTTFHLNCKYHPWGLINDMQMSIDNRKHWHALSHSLHFVRHEGDWRPTHPPQRVSRVPDFSLSWASSRSD